MSCFESLDVFQLIIQSNSSHEANDVIPDEVSVGPQFNPLKPGV